MESIYDGTVIEAAEGWVKTTFAGRNDALSGDRGDVIIIDGFTPPGHRSMVFLTRDEAFRFALAILRDIDLSRAGGGEL